ncbi:hypothetical protein L3X38_044810 [Prunus dulcis]|uniref:Uncharacterized protein n=1 Tax=Prunus dulcis TaxID=3755 RepID=A0AAD4V0P2_PRUDU|nr:hypothetical protein L3X38_044810 [Prunus dulcis]
MQALCRLRHPFAFSTPVPRHIVLRNASFVPSVSHLSLAPPCLATLPCNMQALCYIWHPFAFGTHMPRHITLRHISFIPSAPSCLGTLPCNCLATCKSYAFSTYVPFSTLSATCKSCTFGTLALRCTMMPFGTLA